ncbi:alpha/beta fold hydrolase [Microbacterium thalassium]|uniref:Pimeloyl-ACP methyl ester carboxylesterase n=1 Tax=Microbacterium thalassium TaxID=362649 RepID=A0A7X0FT15_9MICO|nr:alpha/beta fold hydrolase [Microbacterium thalassium]MBB6392984.1 pimeloyl-ACP methyl ester carboxylesterase [Microbacterium thalassium]GLK22784.1 hypothetical protein GCM10017607_01020 [Microbacterium thalassium]
MAEQRTHAAHTSDGITLRASVHGAGPPLVFWHGAYGDGDLDWRGLVPYLTGRFTCYLPSWRGRGLSDDHPDVSYGRRVDDVRDFVRSIGETTGLVGWSGGGNPVLAAAAGSDGISAVAVVEPTMGASMDDEDRAGFGAAVTRMRELAADANPVDALRAAAEYPFNDDEQASADEAGYYEAAARYVPNLLAVFQQLPLWKGPTADDPAVLAAIACPVLVLRGEVTKPFWVRGAQHVADHVPDALIQVLAGAGHAAPLTHPAAAATALGDFFSSTGRARQL